MFPHVFEIIEVASMTGFRFYERHVRSSLPKQKKKESVDFDVNLYALTNPLHNAE